jgi:hypothetical protein
MKRMIPFAFSICLTVGCGSPQPTTGDPSKKVTWAEYQKMDAEQKDDPYVVDNLDDDAKKRLAESRRKKRR